MYFAPVVRRSTSIGAVNPLVAPTASQWLVFFGTIGAGAAVGGYVYHAPVKGALVGLGVCVGVAALALLPTSAGGA